MCVRLDFTPEWRPINGFVKLGCMQYSISCMSACVCVYVMKTLSYTGMLPNPIYVEFQSYYSNCQQQLLHHKCALVIPMASVTVNFRLSLVAYGMYYFIIRRACVPVWFIF